MSTNDPTLAELGIDGHLAEMLGEAGLTTRSQIEQFGDLTEIKGIGPQSAAEIGELVAQSKVVAAPPAVEEPAVETPAEAAPPAVVETAAAEPEPAAEAPSETPVAAPAAVVESTVETPAEAGPPAAVETPAAETPNETPVADPAAVPAVETPAEAAPPAVVETPAAESGKPKAETGTPAVADPEAQRLVEPVRKDLRWPTKGIEEMRQRKNRIISIGAAVSELVDRAETLIRVESARVVALERAAGDAPKVIRLRRQAMVNGVPLEAGEPLALVQSIAGLSVHHLAKLICDGYAND